MSRAAITYGHVIRLPNVLPLLVATALARLARRMVGIAIVFHALASFGSPSLAGWASFAAMAPGLVVSPLAGAFLDRAGAKRGIVLDLAISFALMLALGAAVWRDIATPPVLLTIVAVFALTTPLSEAGIRVLLPRLVPVRALDRVNALDSTIHAIVSVVGPSLGGAMIGFLGAAPVFLAIALSYLAATLCVVSIHGAAIPVRPSRRFLLEALDGLLFVIRRGLLRGLALGYSLNVLAWGILVVAVPVAVARQFQDGLWQPITGLLWAGAGLCGGIGALTAGQFHVFGREVRVMTRCMLVTAVAIWPIAACFGVPGLAVGLAVTGMLAGPIDVSLLTLRQRRTDPGQLGRVLAVSMSANLAGFPIGNVLGGLLVAWSPAAAFPAAALAAGLAALVTWAMIPAEEAA